MYFIYVFLYYGNPGFLIKSEPAPYSMRGMTPPTPCLSRLSAVPAVPAAGRRQAGDRQAIFEREST